MPTVNTSGTLLGYDSLGEEYLGFCRDCYATHYYDQEDLDVDGKPKRKARQKVPFIELAVEHGLASPDTADKTYRRALEKMRKALSK